MVMAGEMAALTKRYEGKKMTPSLQERIQKEAEDLGIYHIFRKLPDVSNKTGQGELLSMIDAATSAMLQVRKAIPATGWLARFIITPMNILKMGIEYSPAGFATLKGNTNKMDQIAKAVIGSTVAAGTYAVAQSGRTTWSLPKDTKERELFYEAGRQPFSINIAPKGADPMWVSFSQLGPLSYPMAMSAALHHNLYDSATALSDTIMQKTVNSMLGIFEFFSDQSYVRALGDIIGVAQGDTSAWTNLVTGLPEQLIPLSSLQGWVNTIIDPVYRKPARDLDWESVADNLQRKMVGQSKKVPYAPSVEGLPQERKNRGINAISPIKFKRGDAQKDKEYLEYMDNKQIDSKFKKESDKEYEADIKEDRALEERLFMEKLYNKKESKK